MAGKTVMDAINDALNDADEGLPDRHGALESEADGEEEGTEVGGEEGGDDDPLLDGLDDEGEEGEEDGEPRVANIGDEAGEDEEAVDADGNQLIRDHKTGKFIKAEDETVADKTAREAREGKGGKGKPDPLNDPIDKNLAQPTQERIRSLIATTKEVSRERDEIRQNFDFMVNGIQATGTTVEQYGEVLSFMALFNSGDPQQQEQALNLLEDVADRLASLLGKERKSTDVLESHKDLQAEVLAKTLSLERAKEIARGRNQVKFRGDLQTSANQANQRETQRQREYQQAKKDLSTLEATLRATDKAYDAKRTQLLPVLKAVFQTIPYSQWPKAFENAYRNMVFQPARVRTRTRTGHNPIRPNRQPAGRQQSAKVSDLDVLNGALDEFASGGR